MKIYLFSDHTGMVAERVVPDYKTVVEIDGSVKAGTLSLGSHSFEIKAGRASVPIAAFGGADSMSVTVTAREGGKTRHWLCGKLRREPSGAYSPEAIDGHEALIRAKRAMEQLQKQLDAQNAAIKKLQERQSTKFLGGAE